MDPRLADKPATQALAPLPPATRSAASLPKKAKVAVDASGVLRLSGDHAQLRSLEVGSGTGHTQSRFVDFSALGHLSHLRELVLYDGLVPTRFDFLARLSNLEVLYCQPPPSVTDLSFLEGHSGLKKLDLRLARIASLRLASPMNSLVELGVVSLPLKQVRLGGVPSLKKLMLDGASVSVTFEGTLKELRHLFVRGSSLRNLDFLSSCPNLETLGVSLSSPTRGVESLLKLNHLKRIWGTTRALTPADRERIEKQKPGVLQLR